MGFYSKLITKYAPQYKFNIVVIWNVFEEDDKGLEGSFSYYMAQPLWYRQYPKIYEARKDIAILKQAINNLKELSTLAAERDITLVYVFPVLHYFHVLSQEALSRGERPKHTARFQELCPELFPEGTATPDFDNPLVYQFVADQIEEFFELFPDLGGLYVHFGEMAQFCISCDIQDTNRLNEVTLRMMETIYNECQQRDKTILWSMHSAGGYTRSPKATIKALRTKRFPEIITVSESTFSEQEFSLTFPTTMFLKDQVECGPAIFAQDCYGEGWDFNFLPFIVDQYLVRHFRDCEKAGAKGSGVLHYIYQGKYHAFNTLQNINLELQTRMMIEGGGIDPEQVKRQWIERHYGKDAAPDLLQAFNRVNPIISKIFYIAGDGAWGARQGFPTIELMLGKWETWIEYFSKPGTPLVKDYTRRTASVRAIHMEQMRQEKREAVEECERTLQDLARARNLMKKQDYDALLARFLGLWYFARGCELALEVGYYFKNAYIEHYDPEAKDCIRNLENARAQILALVKQVRADDRIRRGLEQDIHQYGLERKFLQPADKFCRDLASEMTKRQPLPTE
ncbi:MAG: hypothetical protein ACYTF1_16395 [Planctomycetota bacterium]|jgi:hypothetical protein